jgi:hypothetical protein
MQLLSRGSIPEADSEKKITHTNMNAVAGNRMVHLERNRMWLMENPPNG